MSASGKLEGRPALVTGGASGLGRATAERFAREGAKVMIADIDVDAGEQVVAGIRDAGGSAVFRRTDVTDRADVRQMVEDAASELGGLSVLFNNAMSNPSHDYTEDERWDLMLESGLAAYWAASVAAAPHLAKSGHGSIVMNASIAGARMGISFASEAYSAAKAGSVGLTRKFAKRFGPDGIRVNCIAPGVIETPRWRDPGEPEPDFGIRWRKLAPLGRYGRPDEVASLVLFFACDESSFISGQDIAIDGGFTTAALFETVDLP
ncbi:MAG: SDR family oxidoreductase [Rhodospirillales bacterium]|nr:SDR family oxidoreductase [Rhodospirillales bacterium]